MPNQREIQNQRKLEQAAQRAGSLAELQDRERILRQQGRDTEADEVAAEIVELLGYDPAEL